MKGEIGLESQEGKGSKFWFIVDLLKHTPKISEDRSTKIDLKGLTVLVVDTNKIHHEIICKYIQAFGCDTISAQTGEEAIRSLEKIDSDNKIDLIVTDLYLPGTDGFGFAQLIRKTKEYNNIPIVLLTSIGSAGDGKKCRDIGIEGYLSKPVRKDDLKITIASVMGIIDKQSDYKDSLVTKHTIQESQIKDCQILLVEDYPTNQKVTMKHLSGAGYNVVLAENGEEAIDMFMKKKFDLILMDIQMPVMDGHEATKKIRQIEQHLSKDLENSMRIPIVATTAHAFEGYREKCIKADMDDYLTKPLKRDELITMVDKWLFSNQELYTPKIQKVKVEKKSDAPIDIAQALKEFDNDEEFLNDVLNEFLENVENQLGLIQNAIVESDFKTIEKQSHSIKGGAANLTAMALSRVAKNLETAGREKGAKNMVDIFNMLLSAYKNLCQFVEKLK